MPSSPLSWLVEPVTVFAVAPLSRIPLDSAPLTVAPDTVTPVLPASTRMPLVPAPVDVTWSTVTAEEEPTWTPAKFGPWVVKPWTTTLERPETLKP